MAFHDGAAAAAASEERPWSDLPGDLRAEVYLRFASAYDRARFAAVCSPWRATAKWHPRLPVLPLLLPSTGHGKRDREVRAYSPEEGRALRVPLPWFPSGNRLVGSHHGGWIATVSCNNSDAATEELLVVNLFTGARAALPACGFSIRKMIFSNDPSSADDSTLTAAMTGPRTVAVHWIRRYPLLISRWTTTRLDENLIDIAFRNDTLFGITTSEQLITFAVCLDMEGGCPVSVSTFAINVERSSLHAAMGPTFVVKYIFELHGKLAIAVDMERYSRVGHFYKVFERVVTDDDRYTWEEVTSLGDHALFLGPAGCCKAVHVSTDGDGGRGGVEGTGSNTPIVSTTITTRICWTWVVASCIAGSVVRWLNMVSPHVDTIIAWMRMMVPMVAFGSGLPTSTSSSSSMHGDQATSTTTHILLLS